MPSDRHPVLENVWVVVPAFNEAERLAATLRSLGEVVDNVAVVDDGSSDATSEVARQFPVCLLGHARNRGQGAALRTGMAFALEQGASAIVTFDADGQHEALEIPKLLAPLAAGRADVTLGSRFSKGGLAVGMPWTRKWILRAAVVFTRRTSGLPVTDAHNGLRAFSRFAASQLRLKQDRMAHASELIGQVASLGLQVEEVPVTVTYTRHTLAKGQSSWSVLRIAFELLLGPWARHRP